MSEIRTVRGMHDLIGDEASLFFDIIERTRSLAKLFNFEMLEVPIVEFADVFKRTMGDSSDVVSKEMYNFLDRGGSQLALRPEFTASVMRAVFNNGMTGQLPLKLFSSGPLFRYDRPQKCRQRQFNQMNFELLATKAHPSQDIEMIMLAYELLTMLDLNSDVILHINSIGTNDVRIKYCKALQEFLREYYDDLSEDSKVRFEKNPLRILDSKNEVDIKIINSDKAPQIADYYDNESRDYFDNLIDLLNAFISIDDSDLTNGNFGAPIKFVIDNKLVRGLDYYTHTVFEIKTNKLGAQGSVIAGGRYHNLAKFFSGKDNELPCCGFAVGVERLMGLISDEHRAQILSKNKLKSVCVLAICNPENELLIIKKAMKTVSVLRNIGYQSDISIGAKLNKLLEKANKSEFDYVVFLGDKELENNELIVKDLKTGEQCLLESFCSIS